MVGVYQQVMCYSGQGGDLEQHNITLTLIFIVLILAKFLPVNGWMNTVTQMTYTFVYLNAI